MSLTETEWVVVAFLCTVSLVIGWLSGRHETKIDQDIIDGEAWARHWASVMWVTRRATPDLESTRPINREESS